MSAQVGRDKYLFPIPPECSEHTKLFALKQIDANTKLCFYFLVLASRFNLKIRFTILILFRVITVNCRI